MLSVGFVAGLDYHDPMFDPHLTFQRFKQHPLMTKLLDGAKMVRYGAKALPEGGWHTIPRVYVDGVLIAGDAGGFVNSMRLKGIHLAMRTGMLAAETAFAAVRAGNVSAGSLSKYQTLIDQSPVRKELYPVRNVHQAFGHGLPAGVMYCRAVAGDRRLVGQRSDAGACRSRTDEEAGGVLPGARRRRLISRSRRSKSIAS